MHIPVKRWRGYYRALKRKEAWAIKFSKMGVFERLLTWTYRDELIKEELMKRNFMLDNIKKEDSWLGSALVVPFLGSVKNERNK